MKKIIHNGFFYKCLVCNKKSFAKNYRKKTAITCSRKCSSKLSKQNFNKKCEICFKEFSFIASRIDKAKYCGRSCYYKAMHIKSMVFKTCKFCKKSFKTKKSSLKIYCSSSCMGFDRRKIPDQLTNVRKWFEVSGLINKCTYCGYDKVKEILGIHHLNHNHSDNRIENLIVLCANCHSIEHKKHIVHGGINANSKRIQQKINQQKY